jgi:hypothetical protein
MVKLSESSVERNGVLAVGGTLRQLGRNEASPCPQRGMTRLVGGGNSQRITNVV